MTWLAIVVVLTMLGVLAGCIKQLVGEHRLKQSLRVHQLERDADAALRRADPEFALLLLGKQPANVTEVRELLNSPQHRYAQLYLVNQLAGQRDLAAVSQQSWWYGPQQPVPNSYSTEPAGIASIIGSAALGGLGMALGGPVGAAVGDLFGNLGKPRSAQ